MNTNLSPGDILRERYKIAGFLGAGGMGTVYLADDTRLEGRQCAIKEILLQPGLSDEVVQNVRKQFYKEASTLARLDHPGLPKVSDYFSIDDRDYLVMDFVPGRDLLELTNEARREARFLELTTVVEWIDQLCQTLTYLHSQQPPVLHRDIKPANIKLTPDGRLKLVDFGLVKPLDPTDPSTLTGLQGAGSLPYAPLEQYVDHLGHTSARSDLYALGATMYHLLTGNVPASAQERFIVPDSLPSPAEINPDVSARMANIVLVALAPHQKIAQSLSPSGSRCCTVLIPPGPWPATRRAGNNWPATLRENWWLVGLATGLLAVSLWMTFG